MGRQFKKFVRQPLIRTGAQNTFPINSSCNILIDKSIKQSDICHDQLIRNSTVYQDYASTA